MEIVIFFRRAHDERQRMRVLVVLLGDGPHARAEKSQRDACHVIDTSLRLGVTMINRATSDLPAVDSASHQHTARGCFPHLQQPWVSAIQLVMWIGYVSTPTLMTIAHAVRDSVVVLPA